MSKSLKNKDLHIRLTEDELLIFKKKLEQSKCRTMSEFVIRSVIGKEIYVVNMEYYLDIRWLLSNISNNINQIAKVANTTGYVDVQGLQKDYQTLVKDLSDKMKYIHNLLLDITK